MVFAVTDESTGASAKTAYKDRISKVLTTAENYDEAARNPPEIAYIKRPFDPSNPTDTGQVRWKNFPDTAWFVPMMAQQQAQQTSGRCFVQ